MSKQNRPPIDTHPALTEAQTAVMVAFAKRADPTRPDALYLPADVFPERNAQDAARRRTLRALVNAVPDGAVAQGANAVPGGAVAQGASAGLFAVARCRGVVYGYRLPADVRWRLLEGAARAGDAEAASLLDQERCQYADCGAPATQLIAFADSPDSAERYCPVHAQLQRDFAAQFGGAIRVDRPVVEHPSGLPDRDAQITAACDTLEIAYQAATGSAMVAQAFNADHTTGAWVEWHENATPPFSVVAQFEGEAPAVQRRCADVAQAIDAMRDAYLRLAAICCAAADVCRCAAADVSPEVLK